MSVSLRLDRLDACGVALASPLEGGSAVGVAQCSGTLATNRPRSMKPLLLSSRAIAFDDNRATILPRKPGRYS